jgi:hypothetical protein
MFTMDGAAAHRSTFGESFRFAEVMLLAAPKRASRTT